MNNKPSKRKIWRITELSNYIPEQFVSQVEPFGSHTATPSHERIKQMALQKRKDALNESEAKPMKKTSIHIVLVAAMVILLSVTAFAAFGGIQYLEAIFGDSAQSIEGQITTPRITASADGRDMTLEAMVTDGYVTNLVISLSGAEPSVEHLFSITDADTVSIGWSKLEEFSTKKKSFFMVDLISEQRFDQKQLTLSLSREVAPIDLSFQLENQLGNAVIPFPDSAMSGETKLEELQISPMGFLLIGMETDAKGGLPSTSIQLEYANGKTEMLQVEFAPSDESVSGGGGAVMTSNRNQMPLVSTFHGARNPDGKLVIQGQFSRVIDPGTISKVTVNGIDYLVVQSILK